MLSLKCIACNCAIRLLGGLFFLRGCVTAFFGSLCGCFGVCVCVVEVCVCDKGSRYP